MALKILVNVENFGLDKSLKVFNNFQQDIVTLIYASIKLPLKTNKSQTHNDKQKKSKKDIAKHSSYPIETFDSTMIRGRVTLFQLKDLNLSNPISGPFPERRQLEKSFLAARGNSSIQREHALSP